MTIMTELYNEALNGADCLGGYAQRDTELGKIACGLDRKQSRINPSRSFVYSQYWRLNGKRISKAKLAAKL